MLPLETLEHGAHIASEEDTAKPVVSVAISTKNTNVIIITKIRTRLLETDDDNATNLKP